MACAEGGRAERVREKKREEWDAAESERKRGTGTETGRREKGERAERKAP